MRYIKLSLLLVLFSLDSSIAQDSLQKNHLVIKLAPLTLLDIDNTFQLAVEHRLKGSRWTLSEELGYGTAAANLWANSFNQDGTRFRENFRAKIEARKYREALTGRYLAYELFYKQINDRSNRNVGRECEAGGWACNYYEKLNYPINKHVVGLSVKIGYQIRIRDELKKNTNFVFDFYVGAGLRRIMINHHDPTENPPSSSDFLYYTDGLFINSGLGYRDRNYNIPHLALGLKIGYIIF